jgi:hypothetical protein
VDLPDDATTDSWLSFDSVSSSSVSSVSSLGSVSSLPTVVHAQPTVTTPSEETLEAVRQATIGKKAVRDDDAAFLVTLWDMLIRGNQPFSYRTKAFSGFRAFGRRLFLCAIYNNCMETLAKEFGACWPSIP